MNRLLRAFAVLALSLAALSSAAAQEKAAWREGFAFPKDKPVRILVFRPDVSVGSQTTGGLSEPNADWTADARKLLANALVTAQKGHGNEIVDFAEPEGTGADARLLADYRAMFRAVTGAVIVHKLFPGNRLPTKRDAFDWTLGPGIAPLGQAGGGDYGLFVYTEDAYGSTGRKVAQFLAAGLLGAYVPSGVHIGYAGLVDMTTGDLVWINADLSMGGDVRTAEGATKRIGQLMEDFPTREPKPLKPVAVKK